MVFDPKVKAAEYALNLYHALGGNGSSRIKAPGLYSRARSFPPLIVSSSLLSATAFALSKTERLEAVDAAFRILGGIGSGNDVDLVKEDVEKGEGGGYAIMAALVARILSDAGFCQIADRVAISLAKCLLELEDKGATLAAERIVVQAMQEFKKYVEAFVEKPARGEA